MSPRFLFIFGFAMLAVAMVNASCPCDEGEDKCHCTPMVVRPPKVYRPCPHSKVFCARLNPPAYHGENCGCTHRAVLPAPKQPPRCPCCHVTCHQPCTCSKGPIATIPFTNEDFDVGYGHNYEDEHASTGGVSCGQKKLSAADAVSLHLAYAANINRPSHYVKEGALSYGFMKTPEYKPIVTKNEEINEEGLNVMSKKILELRVPAHTSTFVEEEFHPEDDFEMPAKDSSSISYAELGYMPEKGKSCAVTRPPRPCKHHEPVTYVGHSTCCNYPPRRPCDYASSVKYDHHHEHNREMHSGEVGLPYDSIKSSDGCGGHGVCGGTCGGTCGGRIY